MFKTYLKKKMSLLSCKLKIYFFITQICITAWLLTVWLIFETVPTLHIVKTPGQLLRAHFAPLCSIIVDISISFEAAAHSFLSFSFPLASQVHKVAVESLGTSHWKANLFVCLCQVIWFTVPASIASSQDCLLWAAGAQKGQALITHSFILLTDGQQADIRWWRVSVGWGA